MKQARAKPLIDASRLNIAIVTPAPGALKTSRSTGAPPPSGVKVSLMVPGPSNLISVARYWSPNP